MATLKRSNRDASASERGSHDPSIEEIMESVTRVVREIEAEAHRGFEYWEAMRDLLRLDPASTTRH